MSDVFTAMVAGGGAIALDPGTAPIPAGGARFAGEPLFWLRTDAPVLAFARGTLRIYAGDDFTLYEVTPIASVARGVFTSIIGGLPLQYVLVDGAPSAATLQNDNTLVLLGQELVTAAGARFGVVLQDRICRDPAAWARAISNANAVAQPDWDAFAAIVGALTTKTLRVVDHVGHPVAGAVSLSLDIDGEVTGVLVPAGGESGVDVSSATAVTITGLESPRIVTGGEVAGTVFSAGERIVQMFDTSLWFGFPPASSALQRFRANSHVEPIVDGIPYFEKLVADLSSTRDGGGAYLAGWGFNKKALLDSTRTWLLSQNDPQSDPLTFFKNLKSGGSDVHLIANVFIQVLDEDNLQNVPPSWLAALLAAFALSSVSPAFDLSVLLGESDAAGWVVTAAALIGASVALELDAPVAIAKEVAEVSKKLFGELEDAGFGAITHWARYPATVYDNPLIGQKLVAFGTTIHDVERFGLYHQKIVVARTKDGDWLGYVGGIDIDSNRLDTPLHRALEPFHDVQVRITGPAVVDLATTYRERLEIADPPATVATPASLTNAGTHLVQIARTYYKPKVPHSGLPFAANGERLIYDSLLAGVKAAREYIYIEDQYFTPNNELATALLDAADHAKMLVITVPTASDQLFGNIRRTDIIAALMERWQGRVRIGAPVRRYIHPDADLRANMGRVFLQDPLPAAADGQPLLIRLGPPSRVPSPPFWMFLEGELVWVASQIDANSESVQVSVRRGEAAWGSKRVHHGAGAPALCVGIPGIYVHAKLLIVDDVFLGIGSANMTRRGHFHDGEINAFVVPQLLKRDPANPARLLRCRLWAEHLGLTPEMGISLFADPLSALPYFDRSWYAGSRFQPIDKTAGAPPLHLGISTSASRFGFLFGALIGGLLAGDMEKLWAGIGDATTGQDPNFDWNGPSFTAP